MTFVMPCCCLQVFWNWVRIFVLNNDLFGISEHHMDTKGFNKYFGGFKARVHQGKSHVLRKSRILRKSQSRILCKSMALRLN